MNISGGPLDNQMWQTEWQEDCSVDQSAVVFICQVCLYAKLNCLMVRFVTFTFCGKATIEIRKKNSNSFGHCLLLLLLLLLFYLEFNEIINHKVGNHN